MISSFCVIPIRLLLTVASKIAFLLFGALVKGILETKNIVFLLWNHN